MIRTILIAVAGTLIVAGVVLAIVLAAFYEWCPRGESLLLTRKTGGASVQGQYAQTGRQGVLEQMRGPGRHFLSPWTYTIKRVRDVEVSPGQIRTIKNNLGKELPAERRIAGPDEKGTQRQVLTPGVWRINAYGQTVEKPEKATMIRPGYVGVQTLKEARLQAEDKGIRKGLLKTVLQAGYYNINPYEIKVTPIEIGYRVWDISADVEQVRVNGVLVKRPKEGTGVSFPLADGKQMYLDFTVVWGIFPEDAPRIVGEYGTVEDVESKIIEPQVLSICKNAGSNLTTQQFIEGATREKFQQNVTQALQKMGKEKGIHFLIALVRGFHPAEDIKAAIQARMLAEEEKITLKIEQQREDLAADLEQARRMVDVAIKDFDAETEAKVQKEMEQGNKKAAEVEAQADRKVADLDKQAAEINAQIIRILGQADADVIEAMKKAEATRLELLVAAYGGPDQYNLATFADGLRDDLDVEFRYAGEGTFWTETKPSLIEKAARKMLGGSEAQASPGAKPGGGEPSP
jgi:regulator of protease activity HflC (stomatin/prohibitin superfamily)